MVLVITITGAFGAIVSARTAGTRGAVVNEELAAAPDTALDGDQGSLTPAAGWPMASPVQSGEKQHRKPGRE